MPMLSIKSSSASSATKFSKFKPNRVGAQLLGWWDFSDIQTTFQTVDGDAATADPHKVGQVLNKAYDNKWGRAGNSALGAFATESGNDRPLIATDTTSRLNYLSFDGIRQELFVVPGTGGGGVDADQLSHSSSITLNAFSLFIVFNPANATVSADQTLFMMISDNSSEISFRIDNSTQDTIMATVANGVSRVSTNVASGVNNQTGKQLWTWESNCDNTGNTSKIYKNNDTAVGATNQAGNAGVISMSVSNGDDRVGIGSTGSSSAEFEGNIYEVLFYNGLMSARDSRAINRYLLKKHFI
tara:strand:- start:95 stop:991 length:897 start_codon:yes stop_codon:yes gene_type:complete